MSPEEQILRSFSLTVAERINSQPAFRVEILMQVRKCILDGDLSTAKIMLDEVIEADLIKEE